MRYIYKMKSRKEYTQNKIYYIVYSSLYKIF